MKVPGLPGLFRPVIIVSICLVIFLLSATVVHAETDGLSISRPGKDEGPTRIYVAMGLLDVDVDGAIQQISYDVSAGGTTTTLSRNTEELLRVPSYKEKRRIEKQRAEVEANPLLLATERGRRFIDAHRGER